MTDGPTTTHGRNKRNGKTERRTDVNTKPPASTAKEQSGCEKEATKTKTDRKERQNHTLPQTAVLLTANSNHL